MTTTSPAPAPTATGSAPEFPAGTVDPEYLLTEAGNDSCDIDAAASGFQPGNGTPELFIRGDCIGIETFVETGIEGESDDHRH